MFSHIMVGANDMAESKKYYDAVLGVTGAKPGFTDDKGRVIYMHNGGMFLLTNPIDGQDATHANGGTIGFTCANTDEVDAWHAAGVANGGVPIEDAPGVREAPFGNLYLAYLRDPAGNKICAMHRVA